MEKIYCRDTQEALDKIRKFLYDGETVEVNNEYETFYGVGFDSWLREGIKDFDCDIKVTSMNTWENYPWTYVITPKKKRILVDSIPAWMNL